jgi:hypothetical protein
MLLTWEDLAELILLPDIDIVLETKVKLTKMGWRRRGKSIEKAFLFFAFFVFVGRGF